MTTVIIDHSTDWWVVGPTLVIALAAVVGIYVSWIATMNARKDTLLAVKAASDRQERDLWLGLLAELATLLPVVLASRGERFIESISNPDPNRLRVTGLLGAIPTSVAALPLCRTWFPSSPTDTTRPSYLEFVAEVGLVIEALTAT